MPVRDARLGKPTVSPAPMQLTLQWELTLARQLTPSLRGPGDPTPGGLGGSSAEEAAVEAWRTSATWPGRGESHGQEKICSKPTWAPPAPLPADYN